MYFLFGFKVLTTEINIVLDVLLFKNVQHIYYIKRVRLKNDAVVNL